MFAMNGSGDKVTVPDVTNKSIAQARTTLEQAGFKVGTETEVYSSTVPAGSVVSTDPQAGEQAVKGSTIKINVSKGTEQVTVPDLKGKSADEAQKALNEAGLTGQQGDSVFSDDVDENMVASQETPSGTTANKGDTVVFHLSKGSEKVTIPNVCLLYTSPCPEPARAIRSGQCPEQLPFGKGLRRLRAQYRSPLP